MSPARRERARLRLRLLGGFEARLSSGAPVTLPTRKAQALLAYLGLRPGQVHSRDKLAAVLWGDRGDAQARDSLRHTLVELRRALPEHASSLVADGRALSLDPAAVEVDVTTFEARVSTGTAEALAEAAELYRGDLLDGFALREPPFEEWLATERERLREMVLGGLRRLLEHQQRGRAIESAIRTAARLVALESTLEIAHRALMRLYALQGRRGEALRQYQLCVDVLRRELRAEPETETKHLYRSIVQQTALREADDDTSQGPRVRSPRRRATALGPEMPAPEGRLIGREAETGHLVHAWEAARRGHGQVVMILGEAGIGKSRLLAEVAREAMKVGGRVLLGRCYESEQILPFGPWVDAFRTGGVIADEALLGQLNPPWRAELGRLLPEVLVSGLPAPTDDRLRLFESVAHLVERLGSAQPTVLLLEDLHWADELSLRLVAFVARRIRAAAVLLVATAREEEPASAEVLRLRGDELSREPHCLSLTLSPLSREDTTALVRELARRDGDAAAERLAEQVWAISEGNPFVAVETLRMQQEGAGPRGSTALPLPARIRELIARGLDRVSNQGQELAAVAAVIGREFEFALLQRAAGVDEREAAHGVEELVRRRVLRVVGERFDFTHDRIREVALSQLLPPRRTLTHSQVARALEELYADNLEPHYSALAMHYRAGEVWAKAVTYLRYAGGQAVQRSAHREAVAAFEQGLAALEHVPQTREGLQEAIDLRVGLRHAILPLRERSRILAHLDEALRAAEALGDQIRLALVLTLIATEYWFSAEHERALASTERALAIAEEQGDFPGKLSATFRLGRACHALGDYGRAVEILTANIESIPSHLLHERFGHPSPVSVFPRVWLAWSHAERGDFRLAIRCGEEALAIATAAGSRFGRIEAAFGLGLARLRQGDNEEAIRELERGYTLCQEADLPMLHVITSCHLGYAYASSDRLAEGLRLLGDALDIADSMMVAFGQSVWLAWRAEALLRAGRAEDAEHTAGEALALARHRRERGNEAWILQILGEIAARREAAEFAFAEAHYCAALALANQGGMRPLIAHCHLGLGKLYRRTGKREQTQEHFTMATTMYREMGMTYWLEQAEAELKKLG